jgi:hypothetical protein
MPARTVSEPPDMRLHVRSAPPPGYPREATAWPAGSPGADFSSRRQAFLEMCLHSPAPPNLKAPYYELARLAMGGAVHEGILEAALDYIDARIDCADFVVHAILRLLYQFQGAPLSPRLWARCRATLLGFKYWPDEPGEDSLCTWTENHQILYASAAYLAGQLYPHETFRNSGRTGVELMAAARPRIVRWLDLRFRTGFSEWLSNVYYDEDLAALLSLVDFCADLELAQRAAMVVDLLLFDMAVNSLQGVFGGSHGRSYEDSKKHAACEATADTEALLFGQGSPTRADNMSAVCFALSPRYRMPQVLYDIANDQARPVMINRQRMGIRVEEARRWGLGFEDMEDGMVWLSLEAYTHPRTIDLMVRMMDAYRWWGNWYFAPLSRQRGLIRTAGRLGLLPLVAWAFEHDITRNLRSEVNLYTYRTPDYMLSTAQDYRPGYGGDQQHIWQATLAADAVCFTTHPARREGPTPNYWAGSGTMPRAAQVENVVIVVYNIDTAPGLYLTNRLLFTHAWLPQAAFDEVVEREGWILARKGEGYLALRSQHPYRWGEERWRGLPCEVVAEGKENVWVCELGRRATDGDLAAFCRRIAAAPLSFTRLGVSYESPAQGRLEFGWRGPLRQRGVAISLKDYPRYDNPYAQAEFDPAEVAIALGGRRLSLSWADARREIVE